LSTTYYSQPKIFFTLRATIFRSLGAVEASLNRHSRRNRRDQNSQCKRMDHDEELILMALDFI